MKKKSVKLSCCLCHKQKTFSGKDVKEIIDKIDQSGWEFVETGKDFCPDCWASLPGNIDP